MIAHPSVVRVIPEDQRVQINRNRTLAIRPTKIVGTLEDLQKRPPRFSPQQFLNALYGAYLALTRSRSSDRMKLGEVGQVIQLVRIYDLFTGLPGADRDYSQLDFARDLYTLEESGVKEVRSGARVSFPASTRLTETISFIKPNGETAIYYGIQFIGGDR